MISKKKDQKIVFKKAFSLIELSIVLVIVSILITGALTASVSSVNSSRNSSTETLIQSLYASLGNYFLINGKLPCPAPLNIAKGDANYGAIDALSTDGTCSQSTGVYEISTNLVYGMIPVNELNLLSDVGEDAFGNKLSYIVDKRLTSVSTSGSQLQNDGPSYTSLITVTEKPGNTTTSADFLIISHGANGFGAFPAKSSSAIQNSPSADENENIFNNNNASFIASSINDDNFDDIVFTKRIVDLLLDFNAFSKIKCPAKSWVDVYGTTDMDWPESSYGQEVESNVDCPVTHDAGPIRPTRICSVFGAWSDIIMPCIESP